MAIKKSSSSSNTWKLLAIVFLILLVLLGVRYWWAKVKWNNYAMSAQSKVLSYPQLDSAEDASMIATTVAMVPASDPLYKNSTELESYISQISTQTQRDIVVMDTTKKILADTVPANMGTQYTDDKGNEVTLTLQDGKTRSFTETSNDYPKGIDETVVPMKESANGSIIGAVIMSSSTIFK